MNKGVKSMLKEMFKDADLVACADSGEYHINIETIHYDMGEWWARDFNGKAIMLLCSATGGMAKILTYKQKIITLTEVKKHFKKAWIIKDLTSDKEVDINRFTQTYKFFEKDGNVYIQKPYNDGDEQPIHVYNGKELAEIKSNSHKNDVLLYKWYYLYNDGFDKLKMFLYGRNSKGQYLGFGIDRDGGLFFNAAYDASYIKSHEWGVCNSQDATDKYVLELDKAGIKKGAIVKGIRSGELFELPELKCIRTEDEQNAIFYVGKNGKEYPLAIGSKVVEVLEVIR